MTLPFSTARAIVPAQNQLLWSQDQSQGAVYVQTRLTPTYAQAAPDGTASATKFTDTVDGAPTTHSCRNISTGAGGAVAPNGKVETFSVFVQPGTIAWVAFTINGGAKIAYFNLSGAGAVGTVSSGITGYITRAYDPALAVWGYRCELVGLGDASAIDVNVYTASADGGISYQGAGTGTITVWQYQVEQSNRAGGIAKTLGAAVSPLVAPRNLATPNTRALNTWVPMEFSGCVLWLHAEKGVTIATGVSNWADQSGAGNHATQGTGALQPTWVSSGKVGGRANLRFNGTSQYLAMPSIPVAAWTLAMVHTVDSKQGFGGVISNKSAGVVGFVIPNSSSTAYLAERIIRWDGTTETGKTWNTATGMALPLSAKSYVYTSDFTTFKVDDTQLSPLADGGTGWANALTIGAAAGAYVGMDLAEVMLWNRVLTAAELLQLRKQMIAAWGVRG